MYSVLKKFLALHHHLTLPGVGHLSVSEMPAQIDIANRCINPASSIINFNDEQKPADKFFFNFLARELHIDEVEAIRRFTDFTAQLQQDIKEDKPVILKGFGKLNKQSGILNFEAEVMPQYLPVLTAERVIRKNARHTVMVGEHEKTSVEMHAALQEEAIAAEVDRWWIPAIVLGLIGIAALIYYYNVLHPIHF